jgi:hypothetical protein
VIETKGKNGHLSLEEIAALFDGEDAQKEINLAANAHLNGPHSGAGQVENPEKADSEDHFEEKK